MNATKRKFNALLNGMGTKATIDVSSKEANNAADSTSIASTGSQTKKRRIADFSSTRESNGSLLKPKFPPTMRDRNIKSMVGPTGSDDTPKYAPWDRTAFLQRLKTFSNLVDWTPKPAKVNEVEWAKRGWVCQKLERVRCSLCNVEILVKLNCKEVAGKEVPVYVAQNIEEALVEKYRELIVTSHEENCLWRKRGCDDSIFKLSLNHPGTTIKTLRNRYDELCIRKETLPYMMNMRTPPNFDLDLILSYLPPDFFACSSTQQIETPTQPEINEVAFLMALFGWQGHTHDKLGEQLGSVSCQACFRVLGLWLFKSKEINETGEEVTGAAMNKLDVIKEHRDYCPWQNAASQNGQRASVISSTSSLAGWEIILRILKNDHHLRSSGERLGSRGLRQPSVDNASESADTFGIDVDDEEAKSVRDEKDKTMLRRLRRVKSLFETKGKRLQRPGTRNETPAAS